MKLLGRSYQYTSDPDSAKDNNRANYTWLKENQPEKLIMEDICDGFDYFIRTQDYYYDIPATPKEQYILCLDVYKNEYYADRNGVENIIEELQKRGYTIFFNSVENQSVPEIRHGHIIKF